MFSHITVKLIVWACNNIVPGNMLFFSLYCLISLKITQEFHLLLSFAESQAVFWHFKIRNGVRITEGLDNGDSDNQGPTVYIYLAIIVRMIQYIAIGR